MDSSAENSKSQKINSKTSRSNVHTATLVQGNLWRAIWTMSWPLLLLMLSNAIVGIADVQVAQVFGASAQAAVGLADQIVFLFVASILAASISTNALVARSLGAEDLDKAILTQGQALLFAILMGLMLTVCSLVFTDNLAQFFSPDPAVFRLVKPYLSVYALYFLPFCLLCIINAGFRASGDARAPLYVVLAMTVVNVIGDYYFVYGPLSYLGIKGIAIAGFIASIIGAAIACYRLLKKSVLRNSITKLLPANFDLLGKLIKISIPAAMQRLTYNFSSFVLFFTLKHCENPTAALAAWTIGMRLEAFLFMPMFALGQAVSSIVGQNLGAEENERAYKAGSDVGWLGFLSMALCGIILFWFAPNLACLMTKEAHAQAYTTSYLRILAFAQPVQAFAMIFNGALQGAGDTRTPMWITIFTHWIVRQPLAWILAITYHLGASGVWLAMTISATISGLLNFWRFQSRAWQKLKL